MIERPQPTAPEPAQPEPRPGPEPGATTEPTAPATGRPDELTRPHAIIRSFKDPRTRWTAIGGCLALVVFPILMLLGLIAILVFPSPG